jgi:hypothetical protein
MRSQHGVTLVASLALLAPGIARAQTTYKIQPILKVGDTVGSFTIPADYVLYAGPLTDSGKLAIGVGTIAGKKPELLVQYADGKLTTLVGPGLDGPAGPWPENVTVWWPFGMNQSGNIAFVAADKSTPIGTFLWDDQAKQFTTIAVKGMPAVNNLVFETGGSSPTVINNAGDGAFMADVLNTAGKPKPGIFFHGRDGKLQAVALPEQQLPEGAKVSDPWLFSISDAGVVAFRSGFPLSSAGLYLWEQGAITRVAGIGTTTVGGAKLTAIVGGWGNNRNRSVLVVASVGKNCCPYPHGLYRFAEGTLTPLVTPGQEMPGGGKLKNLLWDNALVSQANDLGQHVFLATLDDGAQAAYLLDADGKLSLVLKSGTTTDMGPIGLFVRTKEPISVGVSLNNRGQVATVGRVGNGPDTLFLLTPAAP